MYVPILKNWASEVKALDTLLDKKVLPHREILPFIKIVEEDNSASGRTAYKNPALLSAIFGDSLLFVDYHRCNLEEYKQLDVSKLGRIREMSSSASAYLAGLSNLAKYENFIPVLSIIRGIENPSLSQVEHFIRNFKKTYPERSLGLCIEEDIPELHQILKKNLGPKDFLFIDIGERPPRSRIVLYRKIGALDSSVKKILLNSPRKRQVKNSDYEENALTKLIDNSARDLYSLHGFNGFGDYAGLRNDLKLNIKNGGLACAAVFLYDRLSNQFHVYMNPNSEDKVGGLGNLNPKIEDDLSTLDPDSTCIALAQFRADQKAGKNGNFAIWVKRTVIRYIQQIAKWLDEQ